VPLLLLDDELLVPPPLLEVEVPVPLLLLELELDEEVVAPLLLLALDEEVVAPLLLLEPVEKVVAPPVPPLPLEVEIRAPLLLQLAAPVPDPPVPTWEPDPAVPPTPLGGSCEVDPPQDAPAATKPVNMNVARGTEARMQSPQGGGKKSSRPLWHIAYEHARV
jgi:hypothetical protein